MEDTYQEYALLTAQIDALEVKKSGLKVKILTDMISKGIESQKNALGKFTISKVKKWEYPEYIQEMEQELKSLQEKAKSTEEATYTETDSLRFTATKL